MTAPTHVVLLRGVNVGKAKRVPMAAFKAMLLEMGCDAAVTLLNSGNAVVSMRKATSDGLARNVAAAIKARFGFDVPVVVKSVRELRAIVSGNTLATSSTNHSHLLVAFMQSTPALRALKTIHEIVRTPDFFVLGDKAAYLHCPRGLLESDAAKALLGMKGNVITTRNWATVLKLHALALPA
jgi:uncharacterized protein (DUF1697 family)